jgi:glycosyltransferase involved in cell wall biosynthesis
VYNERANLTELHATLESVISEIGGEVEVIYVDDGSTDGSFDVLREFASDGLRAVRVLRLRRNFGQTAAFAAGFSAARHEIIVTLDADLQNDPRDIPLVLGELTDGVDVVSGWRADRKDPLLSRTFPSRVANRLISWVTGVKLHDYGCTLKAYRREVIQHLRLYGEMHRFLPALAKWAGANIVEVKVRHHPRRHGQSKYGLGRVVRVVLDLITVKFILSYATRPMQIFGLWGLVSLALGFLAGATAVGTKLFLGHDMTNSPWLYLCIFATLGGVQLFCIGLLGEVTIRTYYESQQKPIYVVTESLPDRRKLSREPEPVNH